MKKFLYKLLLFVPLTIVGYLLMIVAVGEMKLSPNVVVAMGEADHLNLRVKDIRNYHDVDVLFLGSSHCYRTFDTRFYNQYGISCFNLGSSNQTPMQTYVLLSQYLDSLNPKQVIFEVHGDIMDYDGVESAVELLNDVPISSEMVRMALKTKNMKVINTGLYAFYNQRLRHRLENFREDSLINHFRYIPGGFCEVDTCEFEVKKYPKSDITILPQQMKALQDCLQLLRDRDIPYTLVEVQDAEQLRKSVRNHAWFEAQMSALGPYRYKLLPMVDTIHFFNSNHLGKEGILLYNEDLVNDILSNKLATL